MTTFLLFGYYGCPTKSGFHALQANTQAKHEIIQCGETFALSTTGLSRPPWCHWSSFSAVLWNPASLVVSRVIWASFRGFWLPFSEYLRRRKCKAFLFPNPPLFPQCLLGVSGYSCLLMPIGTLCAILISSRTHSQYCWHQPLIYHDLPKKVQILLVFFFSLFWNFGTQSFNFVYTIWKNSLPSFNENFDFHTVLLPMRKDTASNSGMRFMINEEGHGAQHTCYCPSGFNPLCQARENILALNIICSHCN